MSYMNKKTLIALVALVVIAIALFALKEAGLLKKPGMLNDTVVAPLVVVAAAPIGLIGTVVELGANTVTITGQPPGNTAAVVLKVLVDTRTNITKVGPAPEYATSTAVFADFKVGMLLNIEAAAAAEGAIRHAERIIIPPTAQ